MTTWYEGKVVRTEDASPTTKRFWLEVQGEESFSFKAGQFITMDLPIGEKRQQRWRSYSIANAPHGSNLLELCIVHLDGGLATEYLFEKIAPGASIRFKGPDGGFVLPEQIDNELVMVCTGTGVAPFRSMVKDIYLQKKAHQNIHLIFGCRFRDGILYQQEFEELTEKMPGFRYSIALSREENLPDGDHFHAGYVHQIYLSEYAQARPGLHFYLCGWSKMIDEAVANLILKLGYDRSQVKYELYG